MSVRVQIINETPDVDIFLGNPVVGCSLWVGTTTTLLFLLNLVRRQVLRGLNHILLLLLLLSVVYNSEFYFQW